MSYGYATGKEASVEDIAADLLDQLVKIRKNDVSVVKVGQILRIDSDRTIGKATPFIHRPQLRGHVDQRRMSHPARCEATNI